MNQAIESAEAVVIGAGAGLFTSAGFIYMGEWIIVSKRQDLIRNGCFIHRVLLAFSNVARRAVRTKFKSRLFA